MSYLESIFTYNPIITVSLILLMVFIILVIDEIRYKKDLKTKIEDIKSNIKVTHKPFN